MNLDRIHFKVQNDQLLILNQVSEFKKLNLVIKFDKSQYSLQTINTGSKVNALNLKNIEQFKGLKPFVVLDDNQLLNLYDQFGVLEDLDKKDFIINVGDLVNYNNRNFIVLGVVVNTYAQWNLPTPLLFNPSAISNDVKSLYGSRFSDKEIISRINDNFQKGKYDNDIIIPLVDMAKPKDVIKIVKQNISENDASIIFTKMMQLKKADFKIEKDVFINTIADLKAKEIVSLKSTNEELYSKFNLVVKSINDIINKKIQDLPAQPKQKPARKPRAKKEVAPVVESKLITDLSKTKFWFGDDKELAFKVIEKAVELGWERVNLFTNPDALYFDSDKRIYQSSSGRDFFDRQTEREIFYKDLFGEEMPKTTSVEPEPKKTKTQEVLEVDLVFIAPIKGSKTIETKSLYELHSATKTLFTAFKYKRDELYLTFKVVTENGFYYTEKLHIKSDIEQDEFLDKLIEKFDTFVKPELDWTNFAQATTDVSKIKLNDEFITDAFEKTKVEPKVEKPKVEVEKPKPAPKPKVEKPKVEVKKEKVVKVKKEKSDDLSFLNDLDNIL